MRKSLKIVALVGLVVIAAVGLAIAPYLRNTTPHGPVGGTFYDFEVDDIDGRPVKLSKFNGKVLLVVNVASKCGLTPQYKGLQALYDKYRSRGLVVLGFPANEFAGQEPGTDAEVKAFCTGQYGVTFPMFSKLVVKGESTHALYRWLIAQTADKSDIDWNFHKFLVGRNGKVAGRFKARTKPDDAKLVAEIEAALAVR